MTTNSTRQNISFERKKRGQLYMHVWIKPTMQRSKICFGSSSLFVWHVDLQSVCLILNYKASLVRMAQGAKVELDMWISIITYLRLFWWIIIPIRLMVFNIFAWFFIVKASLVRLARGAKVELDRWRSIHHKSKALRCMSLIV